MLQGVRPYTKEYNGFANVLLIDLKVSLSFDPKTDKPPPSKDYKAIWDTGSTDCLISPRVVRELGLEAMGTTHLYGAQSEEPASCRTYTVCLHFPNGVFFPSVEVVESAVPRFAFADVIVGMSFVKQVDFAVTNTGGNTTFTFRWPSVERIDFEQIHRVRSIQRDSGRNEPCPCGSGKKYKFCCGSKE